LFSASSDDVETHVRGRSKPIALHQVGIRCKHCTNVHILQRAKGSTYFPTSVWGIYQASQNMGTTHFVSGQCAHMPQDVKDEFAQLAAAKSASKSTSADEDCMAMPTSTTSTSPVTSTMPCKPSLPEVSLLVKYSGAGRAYWAQSAMYMGLVDTEEGVFFIRTLPRDVKLIDTSSKNAASLATTGVYRRAATKPPKGPLSSSSTALPPGTSRKRPAARTA
jgi:hypothetical protein